MDLDPKLVQRLTRPIHQPGVTNHRMADRLIDRAERLVNRLPLLDQQLARWSAIADLETEDIPIVYAQWGDDEPLAPADGLQTQPQRIQGDPATVPTLATLPVAIAVPMQSSIPPDLSRVEPSQAPQMGTETGNPRTAIAPLAPVTAPILQSQRDVATATESLPLEGVTPSLPPNSTNKLPTAQDQGKLSQSFPASDRGSVPPESITAQVSPQAVAAEPQPHSPTHGPMPVVESFTPSDGSTSSSDSSAPMGGAIAPLGPPTSQTTDVIQAKLETGATQVQPLEIGTDHNNIAPTPVAESLQAPTVAPIDSPETSTRKNPAFDPEVMQAALSLDHPEPALTQVLAVSNESGVKALGLNHPKPDLTGDTLPLAQMPTAISDDEPGRSKLERHSVPKISKSKAHRSPKKSPRQAPSPAQSSPPEVLATPLSPDPASPTSDSMPLVQPSTSPEPSAIQGSQQARVKGDAVRSPASSEPSAPMGGAIAPLGPPTSQTIGVIQAKLETGATLVQPLDVGADHNNIAPAPVAELLQASTVSPIGPPETSTRKNPAFDPNVMQAALSLDHSESALTQVLEVSNESGVRALSLNHPEPALTRDTLPLAQMPTAISDSEPGRSGLEHHSVSDISENTAHHLPQKSPRQAASLAQSSTPEVLATPLSPDPASPTSDSMPLVQPSASPEPSAIQGNKQARVKGDAVRSPVSPESSAPIGEAITPLGPSVRNTSTGIDTPTEIGKRTVQPPNVGEAESTQSLHYPNRPDSQPQTAALATLQTHGSTEGIIQAKFAAGAAFPVVAPSEGSAIGPNPSGFTPLNFAASNLIADPLTTGPVGMNSPVLIPPTAPLFPAVTAVPPLASTPPLNRLFNPLNALTSLGSELPTTPKAMETVVPLGGGDRRFPQHQPIFLGLNRIEGDQSDGAKPSGAIAVPYRVAISPQPLATPSEPGQDFAFVLPNESETAKMPQTARNPAHKEQPALAVFSRPLEVSPSTPTALGVTAPAQASGAASPPPEQPAAKITPKPKPAPQPKVRPQGQRPQKAATQRLTPIPHGQQAAVLPIQPSETRSQRYASGRLTPTPQPQITGNPQGNPTVTATPPIAPLPTVQAQTEFNPQNLEPLVLSRPMVRSRAEAFSREASRASQTRGSQTNTSPVVVSPALPNPPPATAFPGQQSSSTAGQLVKSTTTQVVKQTTPAAVNIDDLVAKVERKVLKRLVVERERRGGQRQWR